jgi:predicted secreted acid phosphatase
MAANHQQQQQQQQGEPRPLVVFDIDETLLSNMPQILDPETWTWEAWVAAAQAQPLQPMAAFYDALCRCGQPAAAAAVGEAACVIPCAA